LPLARSCPHAALTQRHCCADISHFASPSVRLDEKQAQTINWAPGDCCGATQIKSTFAGTGLGALSNGGSASPAGLAAQNELQTWMVNNTRLGIPISFSAETLHSAVGGGSKDVSGNGGGSVMFPMPCMQGCTWNTALIEKVARVIGTEARASGNDRGFSPEINVCTDPRFGRTEENFSEDPALVAAMGVAAVKGLHGGNVDGPSSYLPPGTIVSEAKHAAAYGYGGKDGAGADISERTLYDVYLRPWRDYARNGGRGAMMSYVFPRPMLQVSKLYKSQPD
jgi:beta-glucosidase